MAISLNLLSKYMARRISSRPLHPSTTGAYMTQRAKTIPGDCPGVDRSVPIAVSAPSMAWIDSLSLGVLITALCIFLAGAVTVHAALEGRLSRGWAIAWLVVFAGLGAIAIVNGAHEAADRRHADEQVISREQTESHNWQELFER